MAGYSMEFIIEKINEFMEEFLNSDQYDELFDAIDECDIDKVLKLFRNASTADQAEIVTLVCQYIKHEDSSATFTCTTQRFGIANPSGRWISKYSPSAKYIVLEINTPCKYEDEVCCYLDINDAYKTLLATERPDYFRLQSHALAARFYDWQEHISINGTHVFIIDNLH